MPSQLEINVVTKRFIHSCRPSDFTPQNEALRPVMVGIDYVKQLNVSWGQIMAYATMITVPILILFIAFQRSFINSIASSGVKG